MVKQISIFLENKAGRLASVTKVLGDGFYGSGPKRELMLWRMRSGVLNTT
jgi:hypothetical protein